MPGSNISTHTNGIMNTKRILVVLIASISGSCTTFGSSGYAFREEAPTPRTIESGNPSEKDGVIPVASDPKGDEYSPAVIDDQYVAFVSDTSGQPDIWYVDHRTANAVASRLVQSHATEKAPFFHTDPETGARKCYFVTDAGGTFQVFSGGWPKVRSHSWEIRSQSHANWPHLSPTGDKMLFSAVSNRGRYETWLNQDTRADQRLTEGLGARWNPVNDREFIYVHQDNGPWKIWKYDFDGSPQKLVPDKSDNFDPMYSPDGQFIAYTSNDTGSSDIWIMNADGSGPKQVTEHGAVDCQPVWAPDGKSLFFTSNRNGTFDIYRISVAEDVGQDEPEGEGGDRPRP